MTQPLLILILYLEVRISLEVQIVPTIVAPLSNWPIIYKVYNWLILKAKKTNSNSYVNWSRSNCSKVNTGILYVLCEPLPTTGGSKASAAMFTVFIRLMCLAFGLEYVEVTTCHSTKRTEKFTSNTGQLKNIATITLSSNHYWINWPELPTYVTKISRLSRKPETLKL